MSAPTEAAFMASHGYRAAKTSGLFNKAERDRVLSDETEIVHAETFGANGLQIRRLLQRQGWLIGRNQGSSVLKTH